MCRQVLRRRVKAVYKQFAGEGLVAEEDVERYSVSSLRRGGNSEAAAHGVRQAIRQKHGRWGEAAKRAGCIKVFESLLPRGDDSSHAYLMCTIH